MKKPSPLPPAYILFALACYYSGDPIEEIGKSRWDSDIGKEIQDWLLGNGLVERLDFPIECTDRLEAWVKHLCSQPLPEKSWEVLNEKLPSENMLKNLDVSIG